MKFEEEAIGLLRKIDRDLQGVIHTLCKNINSPANMLINEWCTKEECLKIMGISGRTFQRYLQSGKLPYSKISGMIYVKTSDLSQLLNDNYHEELNQIINN